MSKQLVLIGGGHAHMQTIDQLGTFISKNYGVTVIQPSEYHYYSGMGPGMLGGTYQPEEICFATRRMVEAAGGRFIQDKAVFIDPVQQRVLLERSSERVSYDVLSCNVGSYVAGNFPFPPSSSVYGAKPIERLSKARDSIVEKLQAGNISIAVVGGGPSAAEIAGNVHQLCKDAPHNAEICLFGGRSFFGSKSQKVKQAVRQTLQGKGVKIIEGERVEWDDERITTERGAHYRADIVFCAIGVKPSPLFSNSGLSTGETGGLLVNEYLQSIDYPNIFGGGDCIDFQPQSLDKVGVYAVRQNPVLLSNLLAALEERSLTAFEPGGDYLLIYNLGGGDGVLSKWFLTYAGQAAFRIKDYIDRRFMGRFQK